MTRNRLTSIENVVSVEGYEQARASPKQHLHPSGFTRHPRHKSGYRRHEGYSKNSPEARPSHFKWASIGHVVEKARMRNFRATLRVGLVPFSCRGEGENPTGWWGACGIDDAMRQAV